ncbi:MAG: histidine kinase [Steroidobacteraceae bacterium]
MRKWPQSWLVVALAALAIASLVGLVAASEVRRAILLRTAMDIQHSLDRLAKVGELEALLSAADDGMRSYLLSSGAKRQTDLQRAVAATPTVLDGLAQLYLIDGSPSPAEFRELSSATAAHLRHLVAVRDLYDANGRAAAIELLNSGLDDSASRDLSRLMREIRDRERENVAMRSSEWRKEHRETRWLLALMAVALAGLVMAIARQGLRQSRALREQRQALEGAVRERTHELAALTSHLQSTVEVERAALARELHDELGGLLVAAKMDLNQLKPLLPLDDETTAARLKRIDSALANGVKFKRRVVEELRPTLLDNLGLLAALRWQVEQACATANLECDVALPEEEPALDNETRIGLFRIVQECLSNIMKHAQAGRVWLSMSVDATHLCLNVADDGIGFAQTDDSGVLHHGLSGMRHRARGMSGTLTIGARPGGGTLVSVTVPFVTAADASLRR